MTEAEHINLSNRVRIAAALEILRGVLPGGAIDEERLRAATGILHQVRDELVAATPIEEVQETEDGGTGSSPAATS